MLRDARRRNYLPGSFVPRNTDLFRLSIEFNRRGPVPTALLREDSIGASPATVSDGVFVRPYRDRTVDLVTPCAGIYALWVGGTTNYAEFPYVAPTTASRGNAVTAGDWYIGGWVYIDSAIGGGPTYFVSIGDVGNTAAGTAWAFAGGAGSSNGIFVYSDGTSRNAIVSSASELGAAGWYHMAAEKVGSTITYTVGGIIRGTASFSGALNVPSGGVIRFGAGKSGGNVGHNSQFFDNWQIKPHAVYGGAAFTPPIRPIPF